MRLVHPHPTALRWAAAFALLRVVLLWGAFIFTGIALLANHNWLTPALFLIGTAVTACLAGFLCSLGIRCIVCRCTLFLPKTCEKHPAAKKFLGSRLLGMCLDILFSRAFRCVYCGERCGCRKQSEKSLYQPVLPAAAKAYKSLWQKPPQPGAPSAATTNSERQSPVMTSFSPSPVMPENAPPSTGNPHSATAPAPAPPVRTRPRDTHKRCGAKPFTSALRIPLSDPGVFSAGASVAAVATITPVPPPFQRRR